MWCRTQSQTGLFFVFRVRCACLRSWWTTFCELCTILLTLGWKSRGNSLIDGIFVMPVVPVRELNGLTVFLRPSVHVMCVVRPKLVVGCTPRLVTNCPYLRMCSLMYLWIFSTFPRLNTPTVAKWWIMCS